MKRKTEIGWHEIRGISLNSNWKQVKNILRPNPRNRPFVHTFYFWEKKTRLIDRMVICINILFLIEHMCMCSRVFFHLTLHSHSQILIPIFSFIYCYYFKFSLPPPLSFNDLCKLAFVVNGSTIMHFILRMCFFLSTHYWIEVGHSHMNKENYILIVLFKMSSSGFFSIHSVRFWME